MKSAAIRSRVADFIHRHELIPPGGEVTCFVSGGADSTCLWHLLRELGYAVSALHVDHGLRGDESDADASFCAEQLGAEVVDGRGGSTEDELREIRYSFARDRLRATGHTASDQVETVLYRLVARGAAKGIKPHREDGVVRPLLTLWREETETYCAAVGLDPRRDTTNPETARGLIKVNPIATWTDLDVQGYIKDHDVPVNPLLDQGYLSIGCWPCTRPVEDGEDPRAGRWSGSSKTECGLHV